MLIVWAERHFNVGPLYSANIAVIFATLIAADMATASVDPASRSNLVRGLESSIWYKIPFTFMQFLGTVGCMVGIRGYTAQLAILFIIQSYAFTLTLQRKNIVTHNQTIVIYAIQLTTGFCFSMLEVSRNGGLDTLLMMTTLAILAMSLRVLGGLNKYVVWAITSALLYPARRCTGLVPEHDRLKWSPKGWVLLCSVVTIGCVAGFIIRERKRATTGKPQASAHPLGRLKGLMTKEDKGHVHKLLGMSALLNFLYRFAWVGSADMRLGATPQTLCVICLHAALSATSLIFKIPIRRIIEGSRIWPEYRLHSIFFAYRSIFCMLVTYCELRYGVEKPHYEANVAIVLLTLVAADWGTWFVGPQGRSSTIQELDAPPLMRYLFSVMQFHATSGCLLGVRRFSTQFVYVWIIQFTAFLLTLRRKNLAPHGPLIKCYGVMLAAGFGVATYDHYTHGCWLLINAMANSAAVMRMYFRMNKYVLWTFWSAVVYFFRERLELREGDPIVAHVAWWVTSVGGLLFMGSRKLSSYKQITISAKLPEKPEKPEETKLVRDDASNASTVTKKPSRDTASNASTVTKPARDDESNASTISADDNRTDLIGGTTLTSRSISTGNEAS
jgi:hypothetical protein